MTCDCIEFPQDALTPLSIHGPTIAIKAKDQRPDVAVFHCPVHEAERIASLLRELRVPYRRLRESGEVEVNGTPDWP